VTASSESRGRRQRRLVAREVAEGMLEDVERLRVPDGHLIDVARPRVFDSNR
jgi:hypothetical protein